MLHVLNGDATATVFARAGLDGERLVWRDILAEGPVAADADTPARLDARAATPVVAVKTLWTRS